LKLGGVDRGLVSHQCGRRRLSPKRTIGP
jgi:hypothetical protein